MSAMACQTGHTIPVTLCVNPYPYKAMIAICSDLDETPSADLYFNTSRYLNSADTTVFGRGMDIEVGNTMYFYMPPNQFCYWNASPNEQCRIRDLMQLGFVDSFHSFGDTALSRHQAGHVLDHLEKYDCRLRVWIDHATAKTNLGRDIMRGYGDIKEHPAYHADLTLAFGVKYVWLGRVTSMHGQDAPPTIKGIIRRETPLGSGKTAAIEATKIALGAFGSNKYSMHAKNRLSRKIRLRDGQLTTEFLRSNPNPLGVSAGDTARGLAEALCDDVLDRIVDRRARTILYTHLAKEIDYRSGFPHATVLALEKLADRYRRGEVLVTTTRRLLDYCSMMKSVGYRVLKKDDCFEFVVMNVADSLPLDGFSLRIPRHIRARITRNGRDIKVTEHLDDGAAMKVISVPWAKLSYA